MEAKPARRNPQAPFTTSTLQQEASRKLGFAPAHTMRIAQRLYEGIDIGGETTGLITYMRTDGVQIDGSAITQARKVIGEDYGQAYVPTRRASTRPRPRTRRKRMKRSARPICRASYPRCRRLDTDQAKLYELIWIRTIASQMESAELERTTVDIAAKAGSACWNCAPRSQVVKFDGFLALYQEGKDDDGDDEDSAPPSRHERGRASRISPSRSTSPNRRRRASRRRWSSGWKLGIGRPSTYASILQVLEDRPRQAREEAAAWRGQGPRRGRVPGELLRALCRV